MWPVPGRAAKKNPPRFANFARRESFCSGRVGVRHINKDIAECFDPPVNKSTIAKLVKRLRERADQEGISITDPSLYETLPGRGRPELLDDAQKKRIIEIVTQDRTHREKEPLQAIQDGDFDELPPMSVSTFENVMYEAGYARRKPGWKPPLVPWINSLRDQGIDVVLLEDGTCSYFSDCKGLFIYVQDR
ncbi:hypothetical protein BU23DRAFT_634967 [Bimuria novae-zelandiae CBS 107.79]|uniref:Uncharacterized protein n=1 Tax=Bimuria novae-zelandiae CBS 107.79 TaxID=1447943 RepID=A0A6A5VCX3_9PLEO|nr:hypothetical protein BU23DRAFT_634967 [Bimuria novae-zelandiae CBS 107.79]